MKKLQIQKHVYTAILAITVIVSALQLNLLGKGLISRVDLTGDEPDYSVAHVENVNASDKKDGKLIPARIVINEIGIDLQVVPVPLVNGTWQVHTGVANYAEGTSDVNLKGGNVGVYAHDRYDGFDRIKLLIPQKHSDIILYGNNFRATYQIQTATIVDPTAVDVFYPTRDPMLTLITCDGILSQKRYMVRAKLIKIVQDNNN